MKYKFFDGPVDGQFFETEECLEVFIRELYNNYKLIEGGAPSTDEVNSKIHKYIRYGFRLLDEEYTYYLWSESDPYRVDDIINNLFREYCDKTFLYQEPKGFKNEISD